MAKRTFKKSATVLPLFKLLTPIDDAEVPGLLVESEPHEKASGAFVRTYDIEAGRVLLTAWNGQLHKVIHQTPMESEDESLRRNEALFAELRQNASGLRHRRIHLSCVCNIKTQFCLRQPLKGPAKLPRGATRCLS